MSAAELSSGTEAALAACGRDRVFHSDNGWVAIKWEPPVPRSVEWITAKPEAPGEGHETCGRRAAAEFARRLKEAADSLRSQAAAIEKHLTGGRP